MESHSRKGSFTLAGIAAIGLLCGSLFGLYAVERRFHFVADHAINSWTIALTAALVLGYTLVATAVYRLTLHPLAGTPGPWLAAVSDWYNVYWCLSYSRHLELYFLHNKYGPVVRYGPNRVSINTNSALKEVYNVSANNQKSSYYQSYDHFFKVPMVMTTIDRKKHAFKRRVITQGLKDNALESEDLMLRNIRYFCDMITEGLKSDDEWSEPRNMSELLAWLMSDIMGDVTFSKNWEMMKSETNRDILRILPEGVRGINTTGHMPMILKLGLHRLMYPQLVRDVERYESLSKAQSEWRMEQESLKTRDLFASLMDARDPQTGQGFRPEELISEAGLLIIAGSDTSATGMTSTLFYLLHYPATLRRAVREIRGTFADPEHIRGGRALDSCLYLTACLHEALRLTPGVGGILPREVLPGGMVVDGRYWPAGTDLGVPIYALHHQERYYPSPFVFRPERWIVGEDGSTRESVELAESAFHPFGVGRNSCIGKKIAYLEMSITIARLLWLYDMRLAPGELGKVGEGRKGLGKGREFEFEFQTSENFTSTHSGPFVEFRRAKRTHASEK